MRNNYKVEGATRGTLFKFVGLIWFIFLLSACGGGGGGISRDNTTPDPDQQPVSQFQVSLSIAERDSGTANNELSSATPLRVTAVVTNVSDGSVAVDQLVTFSFNLVDLALFDPGSGTAITDANGVAFIDLLVGTVEGGGLVTARLETGETATIGFNSSGDADPGNNSITLTIVDKQSGLASNALSSSTPLIVNALVLDANSNPVVDELITFAFSQEGLAFFEPSSGTALTNATGVASIELIVGEQAGAGKVIATTSSQESAEIGFNSAGGGSVISEQPAALDFFTSALQLASSGADQVELIALVKDEDNILMEGIEVSFSTDSGELIINQGTTTADGTARATLTSQNNPENREITVTAETGSLTESLSIRVVGTEININAPSSVILDDTVPITIVLVDADGRGIAGEEIQLSSGSGNALSDESPATDETGQAIVQYTGSISGSDIITAVWYGENGELDEGDLEQTHQIVVQEDEFSFVAEPEDDIFLDNLQPLTVSWQKDNLPFAGGTVVYTTTRGSIVDDDGNPIAQGVTDENGEASFNIVSTSAGKAVIGVQGTDNENNVVNTSIEVEFVANSVASIIVAASPNSIGPDGQKSTVTAVLRDARGNLVKGVQVGFTADDVSGGELFPPVATTDTNGLASTVYTSNTVTNEDAITITATENLGGLSADANITVADRAQFISIGTGNQIESPTDSSYLKRFSVFVTDANSNPVDNVALTVTGTPVKYTELLDPNAAEGDPNFGEIRPAFHKGYWEAFPSIDAFEFWIPVQTVDCANEDIDDDAILDPNEDVNGNGILDEGEDLDGDGELDIGEDTNGDGNLTPGNIVSITGNIVTDSNGQAEIEVRYPKTFAAWVTIKITVSTPVTGSESRVSQFYTLGASAADLTVESTAPNTNPFGDGLNIVPDPADPTQNIDDGTARVCTNLL